MLTKLTDMRQTLSQPIYALLLSATVLASCKKENQISQSTKPIGELATLTSFITDVTGVTSNKIVFDSVKQQFIVGGDVILSLQQAKDHYSKANSSGAEGRLGQRRYAFIVGSNIAPSITVYADPTIPAAWSTALDAAITSWNNIDCLVKITRTTTAAGASIRVGTYTDATTPTTEYASYPDALGYAGQSVNVNLYYNSLTADQKTAKIIHAFGHCFGFTHTDDSSTGTSIPETPDGDASSIFNTNPSVTTWSFYDYIAAGIVYPNYPGTKRILRYWNLSSSRHLYTLNSAELGAAANGYSAEPGTSGYIFPTQVTGTVPLYRYQIGTTGDSYYTTTLNDAGSSGYTYKGILGYLYTTQVAGTRPLYHYTYPGSVNFYTVNYAELGAGSGAWVLQAPVGYVY